MFRTEYMKQSRILIGLAICLGLFSCAKDDTPSGDLNGVYNGTYTQTDPQSDTVGTVKLVFVGSNFSGESMGNVKPICNGSYTIFGDSINFRNLCSTAASDLLLVGNYYIKEKGDSLYFIRGDELFSLLHQ
jgi:hypothetical protein